ncbi:MAG: protein kinase [Planctomycetota bacterium]
MGGPPTTRISGLQPALPFRRVGRYELLAELGRGSSAAVYLARADGLERTFALKLLEPTTDQEGVRRFEREAQLASSLEHPGIVPVLDFGRDPQSGALYLVMEHVPGGALDERVAREGALGWREAAELVAELAEAVAAAHALGIVHRDLKPANVLLDARTGRPRVADFGLARAGARSSSLTRAGDVVGTPIYMAPEQVKGEPADERSDIYALGVILYELLTGEPPYRAATVLDLAHRIVAGGARRPRELSPAIERRVEAECLRAMALDPARRHPSAAELAAALRATLTRPEAREPVWRPPLVAALVPALLLLVLLAGITVRAAQLRGERDALTRELEDAQDAQREALAALAGAQERQRAERRAGERALEEARRAGEDALAALRVRVAELEHAAELERAARAGPGSARAGSGSSGPGASGAGSVAGSPLLRAWHAHEDDLRPALLAVIAALEGAPGAALQRAMLQRDLGLVEDAQRTLEQALARGARDPELHLLRFELVAALAGGRMRSPGVLAAQRALLEALPPESVQARYARLIVDPRVATEPGYRELEALCAEAPRSAPLQARLAQLAEEVPGLPPREALRRAEEAWGRALALDPFQPLAWYQLSYVHYKQWAHTRDSALIHAVLLALMRARELQPDPTFWTYGGKSLLTMTHDPEGATLELLEAMRRARAIGGAAGRAKEVHAGSWLLVAHLQAGRAREAEELARDLRRTRTVERGVYLQLVGALSPEQARRLQELYPP